ncbi:MAG: hypothetical protein C5B51_00510 [Terriglobia bacterium]|nr:MAG: hypothetical protein C5B51_00510 [Terriglobia bacterium]
MKYLISILVLFLGFLAAAQEPLSPDVPLDKLSSWLNDWPRRAEELRKLDPSKAGSIPDNLMVNLISWLDTDSDYADRYAQLTGRSLGEGFGDYYVTLAVIVAKTHDPRAARALSKAVQVGTVVAEALERYGDEGADSLLSRLNNPNTRVSVLFTLGRFIEARQSGRTVISDNIVARIKDASLAATSDQSGPARMAAIRVLEYFDPDERIIRVLTQIASSDSFEVLRTSKENRTEKVYPVRALAAGVLRKFGR